MVRTLKNILVWLLTSLLVIAAGIASGASGLIPLSELLESESTREVLLTLRTPRVFLAFVLGAGLALCGSVLQTYFRNDLCCPYTLGVSGYASLGAVIGIYFQYSPGTITLCASLGAFLALGILSVLSFGSFKRDTAQLLLIGIALAFTSSSFVGLIQHLSDPEKLFIMSKWLQGGIEIVGMNAIWVPATALLSLFIILFRVRRELDLLLVSQEFAKARGVNLHVISNLILLTTALFIGLVTSLCGPIAFVGLFTPHIARRLYGSLHKDVLTFSIFLGGCFLVLMDLLSRIVIAPAELPIGIVSGVVGAPFFIFLLTRQLSKSNR